MGIPNEITFTGLVRREVLVSGLANDGGWEIQDLEEVNSALEAVLPRIIFKILTVRWEGWIEVITSCGRAFSIGFLYWKSYRAPFLQLLLSIGEKGNDNSI
jgi:hypothetical protein